MRLHYLPYLFIALGLLIGPSAFAEAPGQTPPAQQMQAAPVPADPAAGTASTPSGVAPADTVPGRSVGGTGGPDIAVILSRGVFFPATIRLKNGTPSRLIFASVGRKPAALIIESLRVERWLAREEREKPANEVERAKIELTRELNPDRVTEIMLDPKPGTYSFHDAISGARGEIIVEE